MHCLVGNSHSIESVGYNWSGGLMGKAIDALDETMVEVEKNQSKVFAKIL